MYVDSPRQNIIVFGQAGAGKSSLINMIAGEDFAETSSDTTRCTFDSKCYEVQLDGGPVILWDTAGLDEGIQGSSSDAIARVYELIRRLEKNGVSLLIYCVRGRIQDTTVKNYEMFKAFCKGKVPIAVVVTALELVEDRKAWWSKNERSFRKTGMCFDDHACIVGIKGPKLGNRFVYQDAYNSSSAEVKEMIKRTALSNSTAWNAERKVWLTGIMQYIRAHLVATSDGDDGTQLYQKLKRIGFPEGECREVEKVYNDSIALSKEAPPLEVSHVKASEMDAECQ
ncbi:hypothetical protein HWV62_26715 [Athelia sp. TMB]|nr:hypothetical protein HWV62_26715 [Athelia sp. TMB]